MTATTQQPLLTIGCAHFKDFEGLWPTIQSIRLNNAELMPQTEFIVVNNSPEDTETANAIRQLLSNLVECAGSKYVELPGNKGTSLSRNEIFKHATGKYTVVMDCHLEFWPGSFKALMDHYATDPESNDIISGPLLYDSLRNVSTHFNDEWDDAMWGKWGQAWKCQCGADGVEFSLLKEKEQTVPILLRTGRQTVHQCRSCRKQIPVGLSWSGHESKYINSGFFPLGLNPGPAFEIPGQGLGLFSCRTAAWPGFNEHAIGFGGEELYIHEKFRQRGGRALCVPGMKWNHRFYRQGGAKYPNTNYWKCRNYVLEFNELGLPLDVIRKHFVEDIIPRYLPEQKTYISKETWDYIVSDPIAHTVEIPKTLADPVFRDKMLPELDSIEKIFDSVKIIPRDLNEHMEAFRALVIAAKNDSSPCVVVELTGRRESTLAFIAGRPESLVSYSTEVDQHCYKAANLVVETTKFEPRPFTMDQIVEDMPENDLLFIDTRHNFKHLTKELEKYNQHCRRFIVLHDTEVYGVRGDDSGLGLNQAIAEFCDKNPKWAVIDHTKAQYGLTVLSCLISDRPEKPVEGFNIPHGPGSELKKILNQLGIHPSPDCSCNSRAAQMDIWGVEGCEKDDNFKTIVGWLKEGTWKGLTTAAFMSFATGIAFEINILHPYESLVRLCLKRAKDTEEKRTKGTTT